MQPMPSLLGNGSDDTLEFDEAATPPTFPGESETLTTEEADTTNQGTMNWHSHTTSGTLAQSIDTAAPGMTAAT
jgi:hypothetical protein